MSLPFYIFKKSVHDMNFQEWYASFVRLFKHIKDNFIFEAYMNMNNRALRTAITKVRLSSRYFFFYVKEYTEFDVSVLYVKISKMRFTGFFL